MQLQLTSGRKDLHLSDRFDVLLSNCCHRPRSMRNRVCVTVRCPSVSVPFARCSSVRRVCCCGAAAGRRYRSITAWPAPRDTTVCSQLSRLSAAATSDTCFFFFLSASLARLFHVILFCKVSSKSLTLRHLNLFV